MSQEQPRPGQTTLAGALIIGGGVIVVLAAWQRVATLHTLDVQEEFQRMLAVPPWSGTGLSTEGLSTLMRVLSLVGAAAGTAAAILGVQVFKRSASARIVLTALSPFLVVGGMATAAFLAPMVVAGIALLWLQPTRDWYAGRPWVAAHEERRAARAAAMRGSLPPAAPAQPPSAVSKSPSADAGHDPSVVPPPPPGHHAGRGPAHAVRGRRPGALVGACVLAWVGSSVVVLGLALTALVVGSESDALWDQVREEQPDLVESSGITQQDLVASLLVVIGVLVVWAVVAIVLAGLTFLGHNWARITLVVSSVVAGLLALVLAVAAPPTLLLVGLLAVSGWLLLRPEVGRWFLAARR